MASPKALLPIFVALVAALSVTLPFQQSSIVEAAEFDLFVFSLYWPGYVCQQSTKPHCCFENDCCRLGSRPEFVINGLWPDYENGSWPQCCAGSALDEAEISPLIPALKEWWPNLYCGSITLCNGEKGNPWAYEWELHGTCTSPVLRDQYTYFMTAINLYRKFNITKALKDAGFVGSNSVTYPLNKIVRTIKKTVGASPLLLCQSDSLYQVRLCFNKDFTARDCGVTPRNCPKFVSLPTLESPVHEDGNAATTWMDKIKAFNPLIMI